MEELVVEWTMVRRPSFVVEVFNKSLSGRLGAFRMKLLKEQFADDSGRVDLIYESDRGHIFLVELETSLLGKYTFCMAQTKRYMSMASRYPGKEVHTVILYAKDQTPDSLRKKLVVDCGVEKIDIVEYEMLDVQKIYDEEIDRLSKNIGLKMVDLRSDMPYTLSAVNRFMLAFKLTRKRILTNKEIGEALLTSKGKRKGKPWSQTSVVEHSYLAEGMGLIERGENWKVSHHLTEVGEDFIARMDTYGIDLTKLETVKSKIDLSLEQKRIILTQLLKDNYGEVPRYKAMIFLFLRFLSITRGEWVPKQRNFGFSEGDIKLLNHIFGTNWATNTNMGNILTWSRNYCGELGLIEIIKGEREGSERVVMTTLGSRVYGLLEMTQSLKREIIHIPQQIS